MKNVTGILVVVFSLPLFLCGCGGSNSGVAGGANGAVDPPPDPPPGQPVSGSFQLVRVTSEPELEAILKAGIGNRTGEVSRWDPVAMDFMAGAQEDAAAVPPAASSTNLQIGGVDEADSIKNDSSYLYHVVPAGYPADTTGPADSGGPAAGSRLRILRMSSQPERTEKVAEIELGGAADPAVDGLYLVTGRPDQAPDLLVTLAGRASYWPGLWFDPWYWNSGLTRLSFYNVDSPESPVALTSLELDGALISSRRIGETLYLVTRFQPGLATYMPVPGTDGQDLENQALLDDATLADLLPDFRVDQGDPQPLVRAVDCYAIPTFKDHPQYGDVIAITAIDLANPGQPVSQCVVGATETIFVSTTAIYLAATRYRYGEPGAGDPGVPELVAYPETIFTDIHKFGLDGTALTYGGSGSVAGHLGWEQDKKSFRFGEVGEAGQALGVVTSMGETWSATATTRLTLLGAGSGEATGSLTAIGQLPNDRRPAAIGKPGEQLYAARFLGDRLYLVTFRVVDPLYAIDLSDPTDPAIIGELSIPGYSDYLHPVGDDLLLGIGKDAVADPGDGDGRGAWYQGVKLSLFDVSQPGQPVELQSLTIGKRGSDCTVLADHHGFSSLVPEPAGAVMRFALPISRHDGPPLYGDPAEPWTGYGWSDTALHLFELDTRPGAAAITSQGTVVAESAAGPSDYPQYPIYGDRSVLTATGVHYLHGGEVRSVEWGQVE